MCQHKSSHRGIPGAYGAVYFHRMDALFFFPAKIS
jgi:hypothetical protein